VDAITQQVIALAVLQLLMCPVIVFLVKRMIGKRLDSFDKKRDDARAEQAERQRQRDAERSIVLAIARTMLLDNYEKCTKKGYYSLDEREVYSLLYDSYKDDGGNGVIDAIAERIRELPMEPPKEHEHKE
jgi:hypothetical protein